MNKGSWVWPPDPRAQRRVLRKVAANPHMVPALTGIAKSKEGMSNSELDDVIGDNSEWMTLWVIRQLTSLGFVEFTVDFFGNPARYKLTDLGRNALAAMTGQPPAAQPRPQTTIQPAAAAPRPQTPPSSSPPAQAATPRAA